MVFSQPVYIGRSYIRDLMPGGGVHPPYDLPEELRYGSVIQMHVLSLSLRVRVQGRILKKFTKYIGKMFKNNNF